MSPVPMRRATAAVVPYARKMHALISVRQHGAGDPEPGERGGPQVADDRGVREQEQRLGDQGEERRQGQPQDRAVLLASPGHGPRVVVTGQIARSGGANYPNDRLRRPSRHLLKTPSFCG